MAAATGGRARSIAIAALVAGPALLAAGAWIGYSPNVIFVLPMGAAWVQGAIALPLVVLGPTVLSLGWLDASAARAAKVITTVIALLFVAGVASLVALTFPYIGCQPVTDPIQALPLGLAWGAVCGVGLVLGVRTGARFARRRQVVRAIIAGAVATLITYLIDALAFAVLFPPLSCRPPV